MKERTYTIHSTPEYVEWLNEQTAKSQVQIFSRVSHIQDEGHFGDHKDLCNGVCELRWKNGRRVYHTHSTSMAP